MVGGGCKADVFLCGGVGVGPLISLIGAAQFGDAVLNREFRKLPIFYPTLHTNLHILMFECNFQAESPV